MSEADRRCPHGIRHPWQCDDCDAAWEIERKAAAKDPHLGRLADYGPPGEDTAVAHGAEIPPAENERTKP